MELEDTVSAGSETISPLARSEFNMEMSYHLAFLSTTVFLRVPCWGLYYLWYT